MPDDALCFLSATDLLPLYRRKEVSPVEVARACLARIETHDAAVNGVCHLDPDHTLAQARASETRWHQGAPAGPVDGIPTTVKDLILYAGWPTRRGSLTVRPPAGGDAEDAPSVARLRAAGAVFLGKTTTPEFGWKGVTDNPLTGITRNPWDTSKTPGGSSGGAATAAALGMGCLHIGTDGGGSIRIPAGFTGIVGLKGSYGRVPAHPPSPFYSVAHIGPMTRTVADAALMHTVMSGYDARDWLALPTAGRDYRIGLEDGVAGLRIAYSPTLGYVDNLDPEVKAAVDAAVAVLADMGAVVDRVDPPLPDTGEIFARTWFPAAGLLLSTMAPEAVAQIDPGLQETARWGQAYSGMDLAGAALERVRVGAAMKQFHHRYDLLVTPTLPLPAFTAGRELPTAAEHPRADRMTRWTDWARFSFPFNLTGQPAISVPCGRTTAGLPIGLQLVGPMHDDALVLRAARAYEAAIGRFPMPQAPTVTHTHP